MLDTTVAAISSLLEASCHMLTLFPFFTEDSAVIRRDSTSAHVPLSKTKVPLCPHPNPSHLLKDLPPAFPTSFSFIFIFHFPLRSFPLPHIYCISPSLKNMSWLHTPTSLFFFCFTERKKYPKNCLYLLTPIQFLSRRPLQSVCAPPLHSLSRSQGPYLTSDLSHQLP